MRIVYVSDWFAEVTGYAENTLPKAVAGLGHDVHLIASDVQPYYNSPSYASTYGRFLGPAVVPVGVKQLDRVTVHRLRHGHVGGRLRIRGLMRLLWRLAPHVVQTFEVAAISTYEVTAMRPFLDFRLFVESHVHASVFNAHHPGWRLMLARGLGMMVGATAEKCYAIGSDVADIAASEFGIPRSKIEICSLGVDTQLFRVPTLDERLAARLALGYRDGDIVCIYTGRFSRDKGPHLLAQAIDYLVRAGLPYRGLFIGGGTYQEVDAITSCRGCDVRDFVPARSLPEYYWAADIGVWPRQESTSQLDAAAAGLPIVVSDAVHVRDRVEGNGLFYRDGDVTDLIVQLQRLGVVELRRQFSAVGALKMHEHFSWTSIARARVRDYEAALRDAAAMA